MATRITRYYVNDSGSYLGAFEGDAVKPAGGIEVAAPPEHGLQKWLGDKWGPLPEIAQPTTIDDLERALIAHDPRFAAALAKAKRERP